MIVTQDHILMSNILLEGQALPPICGTTLAEEKIELPKALFGQPSVVTVAFTSSAQPKLDSWLKLLATTLGDWPIPYYSVYLISDLPYFLKGLFHHHFRQTVPNDQHDRVVVGYGDLDPYFSFFKPRTIKDSFCFLLDQQGVIRFAAQDYATPDTFRAFVKAFTALDLGYS